MAGIVPKGAQLYVKSNKRLNYAEFLTDLGESSNCFI
jgi:hypothetical protein